MSLIATVLGACAANDVVQQSVEHASDSTVPFYPDIVDLRRFFCPRGDMFAMTFIERIGSALSMSLFEPGGVPRYETTDLVNDDSGATAMTDTFDVSWQQGQVLTERSAMTRFDAYFETIYVDTSPVPINIRAEFADGGVLHVTAQLELVETDEPCSDE